MQRLGTQNNVPNAVTEYPLRESVGVNRRDMSVIVVRDALQSTETRELNSKQM